MTDEDRKRLAELKAKQNRTAEDNEEIVRLEDLEKSDKAARA